MLFQQSAPRGRLVAILHRSINLVPLPLADARWVPHCGLAAGLAHRRTGRSLLPDNGPDPGSWDHHHLRGRQVLVRGRALLPRTRELHPHRRLGPQRRYLPRLRQRSLQRLRAAAPPTSARISDTRRPTVRQVPRGDQPVQPLPQREPRRPASRAGYYGYSWAENIGCRSGYSYGQSRHPRVAPELPVARSRRTAATGGTSRTRSSSGSASASGSTARESAS